MVVAELIEPLKEIVQQQKRPVVAGSLVVPSETIRKKQHSHGNWELLLCPDHIQLNPPGVMHETSPEVLYSYFFDVCSLSCSLRSRRIFYRWRIPDSLLSLHLAPELLFMMQRSLPAQPLSDALFYTAVTSLSTLLQKIDESPQAASFSGLARLVVEYLKQHYYQSSLSSEDLGEVFGMSPQYLNRALHSEGFSSIRATLSRIRLEKAVELLKTGEYSVSNVSQRTGWQSPFYFSKRFREYYGISPSEFQKEHRIRPFHRKRLL